MSIILEEQYNAERAKPPKHTSGTISTWHRPTTATEPTHDIDPNNVEQNLITATKPTVILKYQTQIKTEMTQIETGFFKNPLNREWILKRNRRIFVETYSVLKRRQNDDGGTTHPRHYNTLRQKLQPPTNRNDHRRKSSNRPKKGDLRRLQRNKDGAEQEPVAPPPTGSCNSIIGKFVFFMCVHLVNLNLCLISSIHTFENV